MMYDGSNSHAVYMQQIRERERDAQVCVDVADSYKSVLFCIGSTFLSLWAGLSIISSRGDVLGVSLSRFGK